MNCGERLFHHGGTEYTEKAGKANHTKNTKESITMTLFRYFVFRRALCGSNLEFSVSFVSSW